MCLYVLDYTPWIIYLGSSEQVSVIPSADLLFLAFYPIIRQHLHRFIMGKPEIFSEVFIPYRADLQMIQSGKNTFFADPQTPSDHGKLQVIICL